MKKLSHRQKREHKNLKTKKHLARLCLGKTQTESFLIKIRNK